MLEDRFIGLKLKMLLLYGFREIRSWWTDVWQRDGAESVCCSGYECGCYGADNASHWEWAWERYRQQDGG